MMLRVIEECVGYRKLLMASRPPLLMLYTKRFPSLWLKTFFQSGYTSLYSNSYYAKINMKCTLQNIKRKTLKILYRILKLTDDS